MYSKQRYWYIGALLILLVSLAAGGWAWSKFQTLSSTSNHTSSTPQSTNSHPTSGAAAPTFSALNFTSGAHLLIPSIGVNAPIEPVGVDPDGKLSVPHVNEWTGVGWYKNGPIPGQKGSAVLDGHLDRPGGLPAVFWNLHNLHVGDTVMVSDSHGHMLHFHVLKLASYTPQNAPTDQIFGNASGTFLNLITCAGTWIPAQHQTTLRLVVYTQLDQTA